jgi:hypothetical protein
VNAAGCLTLLAVFPFSPFRSSWLYTSMASAPAGAQGVRDALDVLFWKDKDKQFAERLRKYGLDGLRQALLELVKRGERGLEGIVNAEVAAACAPGRTDRAGEVQRGYHPSTSVNRATAWNPAAPASLTVTGIMTPTTAGVARSVTVQVLDGFGNT